MHWRQVGTGMVALMMMTGCPSEFGKEGRIAKAIHQDSLELTRKQCDEKTFKEFCGGEKANTPECIRECG